MFEHIRECLLDNAIRKQMHPDRELRRDIHGQRDAHSGLPELTDELVNLVQIRLRTEFAVLCVGTQHTEKMPELIQSPAPGLLDAFFCGVPEFSPGTNGLHVAHPGCFTTAALLAAVPLVASGLAADDLYLTGVTGSTGSGRNPKPGTHHPERHSNLFAYQPLHHRHAPEIVALLQRASGKDPNVHFVPHSAPLARGIHMTVQAALACPATDADIEEVYRRYYANSPFVRFVDFVLQRYFWAAFGELFRAAIWLGAVGVLVAMLVCVVRGLEGERFKMPLLGDLADRL